MKVCSLIFQKIEEDESDRYKSTAIENLLTKKVWREKLLTFGLQRFYVHNFSAQAYFDTLNTEEIRRNMIGFHRE